MIEELPRDPAAERAVLAGVYRHSGNGYLECDGIVLEEVFTDPFHKALWRCYEQIFTHRPDATLDIALVEMAATALQLEDVFYSSENTKLFRGITNFAVELGNIGEFAQQIRKLHIIRGMRRRLQEADQAYEDFSGLESLNDIVGRAESAVFDYERQLSGESEDADLYGAGALEHIQYLANNPVSQVGYPSGFPEYDRAIGGGLRPGGIDMIVTKPKTGKSFVSDATAIALARAGVQVLIVDTEMPKLDRLPRSVAMLSGVKLEDIETGNFRRGDREKAEQAAREFSLLPIHYKSVVGMPLPEVISMMRRWVVKTVGLDKTTRKAKPSAVIFDYIKLTDASQVAKLQEYQAVGFLMTQLHAFMVRYGVACRAFTQLNRQDDVSQSDRIKWLCTSFSKMRWKEPEDLAVEYSKPRDQPRYTHIMEVAVDGMTRYGAGLAPGDFIHIETDYSRGYIAEGPLNSRLDQANPSQSETLAEVDDEQIGFN